MSGLWGGYRAGLFVANIVGNTHTRDLRLGGLGLSEAGTHSRDEETHMGQGFFGVQGVCKSQRRCCKESSTE